MEPSLDRPMGYSAVTVLSNELFVLKELTKIHVYNRGDFTSTQKITDPAMKFPECLVASRQYNCLYLSDKALGLIFRVELPTEDVVVITNWKVKGRPDGLSNTRSKNPLVTVPKARAIKEFTTRGILIKHIQLDASMKNPKQAVQLFSGDYVIGHAGGQQHRVCIVDADGNVKLSYGGPRGIGP